MSAAPSPKGSKVSVNSPSPVSGSVTSFQDVDDSTTPDFIYGGPFIKVEKPSPFLNTATPINVQLQGTFKKSFAYYSLKERLPIILTKVIDYLSRQGSKIKSIHGANDEDIRGLIQYITKLKNDLMTNKTYDLLKVDTPEAKRWNEWIQACDNPHYFTNIWVFSECYVYRRLREGCELSKKLQNFDPFDEQKDKAFASSLEPMCIVAEKLVGMLPPSDKDKRKADFMTLLKICLWANKCDLSLSAGEQVSLKSKESLPEAASAASVGKDAKKSNTNASPPSREVVDPFQMIVDYKDKLLVDDTGKIADQVVTKAENMAKAIEGNTTFKYQCSCHRLATAFGMPLCKEEARPSTGSGKSKGSPPPTPPPPSAEGEEEEKIPCPAKMTIPQAVMFDIVCDNSGYELFSDLCLAHFLVSQNIVQKVRFHVKKIPWFVSDVTPRDFKYVIDACSKANFNREIPPEPKPEPAEGEAPPEPEAPRVINSGALRQVGEQWAKYVQEGVFILQCDDFWTSPHVYKDMKRYDFNVYRKLQFAVAILFKGDLNYRKLLGEKNWNPVTGFEPALQGFLPAPVIAVRTVKADLICGLPKGKWEQLNNIDPKWMETGDYGVIQFCPKAEPLKISDRPCLDYGQRCFGVVCPTHTDL